MIVGKGAGGLGPIAGRAEKKYSRNMDTPMAVISDGELGLIAQGPVGEA